MPDDTRAIEKLVEELQFQVPFKSTTEEGDLVLVLRENDDGLVSMGYARIMGFDLDVSKRDEWWHVHFLFLEVPPLPQTITLQTDHITGVEIFTMGGRKVFIKAINHSVLSDNKIINRTTPPKKDEKKDSLSTKKVTKPTFTLVKPQ